MRTLPACLALACGLALAIGAPAEEQAGFKWGAVSRLRARAESGEANAQAVLGSRYDEGRGVPRDLDRARGWFLKAAEQDHAQAQFALGAMYANGEGVAKDIPQALMWLNLSAARVASSRYLLFRLQAEVSEEQLAEGQQLAEQWRHFRPESTPESEPSPPAANPTATEAAQTRTGPVAEPAEPETEPGGPVPRPVDSAP